MMGCLRYRVNVFFVSFCWLMILAVAQTTHPSEVNGLLAVKKSLVDPMKNLKKWNKGDPCTSNWTGVLCSSTISNDGYLHVQKLHLLNMNLSGTLAPELGQLSQLEILDFMWNELTGIIPKEISNIAPLRLLLLSGNKLSGSLPEEFGVLSYLNRIQIDENNISGPLPKSIGNMSRIKHLHFNNNSLSGQIPFELSNASTLLHMLFDNNNLSGHLPPEFSKLSNLRIMQFDNNHFEGNEIPSSYGNFSKLVKLSLRNCRLQGAIPDLSQIPHLSYLDLSFNLLSGSIPSNTFSHNMTTIDLSSNHLNGSIPESFSDLPLLQRLSLWNNFLSGSVPANIWRNKSFSKNARIRVDLRNNSFSIIEGDLNIPQNVTLRLQGNPICNNANIRNIGRFCRSQAGGDETPDATRNSTTICPIQACPVHNHFEYVPASPVPCYCASPLRVGFRLKSPSFSYFPPYEYSFDVTLTSSLSLDVYQLVIDSYCWEEGPRLRMDLKLFPMFSYEYSSTFNKSEIERLKGRLSSWDFRPSSDFFGPYELLNFTLLGPYADSDSGSETKNINKGVLAGILVGSIIGAITFSAIISILIARRRAKYQLNMSRRRSSSKISMKIDGVKSFTFKEMVLATDNFNYLTQVGRGGYGKVFKGVLSSNLVVAVKRAEEGSLQGQKEFLTEIELLSRLHHRNLVALIGYCDEEEEQMLVYEFMSNGTLRDWISDKDERNLSFRMRLHIALGSAKGILYLHTEATPPIFHRDIKATNILLDSKLTAKVADFGLSRLAPMLDDEGTVPDHVSTVVKGTPGYLDPEYFLTRKLTDKSDVYSLGVVFLELLTGMHPIYHGKNIVREVNIAFESGMIFSIIDSKMGTYPSECVERFVALAISCCHEKTEERPSMLDVVRELENILKMMPETDTSTSISEIATPEFSVQSFFSPSSDVSRNNMFNSSEFSGSELVSGVAPIIRPR